jgi:hypothetical protein
MPTPSFGQIFRQENRILYHIFWFPADVRTHTYHFALVQIYLFIFYFSSNFTAQKINYINAMKSIDQSQWSWQCLRNLPVKGVEHRKSFWTTNKVQCLTEVCKTVNLCSLHSLAETCKTNWFSRGPNGFGGGNVVSDTLVKWLTSSEE